MNALNAAAVADLTDRDAVFANRPPTIAIAAELRAAVVAKLLLSSDTKLEPAAITDDLTLRDDLGLASIDSLELALDLDEELGVVLEDEELFGLKTVGDLMSTIAVKLQSRGSTG